MAGMRKRTLSSDTTDSSENEDGGVSPTYNLYGQNEDGQRRGKTKVARQGMNSLNHNAVLNRRFNQRLLSPLKEVYENSHKFVCALLSSLMY